LASGALFEVVAIDEPNSTTEYQLLDGELGEYDLSTWCQLSIIEAEAPEDWRPPPLSLTAKIKPTLIKCLFRKTSLAIFYILSRIHWA
jgi:hypothetical protein